MDARLKTLKPGDKVRLCSNRGEDEAVFVSHVGEQLVMVAFMAGLKQHRRSISLFITESKDLILPDPPKAEPGKVYERHPSECVAVGTSGGGLMSLSGSCDVFPFTPDWTLVEDQP